MRPSKHPGPAGSTCGAPPALVRPRVRYYGEAIRVYDFLTRAERLITPSPAATDGYVGGDAGLMDAFIGAVATGNRELIRSGPRESLASHLAVFAAEHARLNGTVEAISF
jgi:hypothetical protein